MEMLSFSLPSCWACKGNNLCTRGGEEDGDLSLVGLLLSEEKYFWATLFRVGLILSEGLNSYNGIERGKACSETLSEGLELIFVEPKKMLDF